MAMSPKRTIQPPRGITAKTPPKGPAAPRLPGPKPRTSARRPQNLRPDNAKFTNVNDVAALQDAANRGAVVGSNLGQNANVTNDFGQSTTTVDPNTGQATVSQGATGTNAQILQGGQGLANTGMGLAQNMLGGMPGLTYNTGNIGAQYGIPTANSADRARYEDDVYKSLTRDLNQNYTQAKTDKQQELANRGIPLGSELYTQEMDRLDKGLQRQQLEARSQATAQGGQEMSNQFGMGLQAHQQALGDYTQNYNMPIALAQSLSGLGYGYQNPNLPQFQGSAQGAVNYGDLGNLAIGAQEKQRDRAAQERIARIAAARQGGGGGQAPAPEDTTPPFAGSI